MQPARSTPIWLPTGHATQTVPAGRWFDAVRVSSFDGIRAITRLQERSGPVLEDQVDGVMTWLVPTGSTATWDLPGVDLLSAGRVLTVPPASQIEGMFRWLIPPPPEGDCITTPEALRQALAEVLLTRPQEGGRDA